MPLLPCAQASSVSGRWKLKTVRLRGSGSRALVKRVSTPGALVEERQGPVPGGEGRGQARAVLLGLHLHPGERLALLLGLDHADRLAVRVQQVIRRAEAGGQSGLPDGDPALTDRSTCWRSWTAHPAASSALSMPSRAFCSGVIAVGLSA